MLLKIVYVLMCRELSLAVLVFRGDLVEDAELPVLRHENAVLRRHVGRVRYASADRQARIHECGCDLLSFVMLHCCKAAIWYSLMRPVPLQNSVQGS